MSSLRPRTTSPELAQVKGALLNEMLRVMVKDVGLAKYAAAVDHFDAQFRDLVLQKRILDGSWYNVQFANAIMTAAYAPAKNAADVCRISGIDVVTHLLGGIHRFLIQNLSPTTAVRHADLLFRNYYRGGIMKGFITSHNAGYIQATGFYGMQTNLWQAICGGTETILMATGIKHVETSLDTSSLAKHVVVIHLTWF